MQNKLTKFHRNNIYRLDNNRVLIRKINSILYQNFTGGLIISNKVDFDIRPIIVKIGKQHYIVSQGAENTDLNITRVSKSSGDISFQVGKSETLTTIASTSETIVSFDEQGSTSFFLRTKQPDYLPALSFRGEVKRLCLTYVDETSFVFDVDVTRDSTYRVYAICNKKDAKILIKDLYDDM